jgi:hypothetical protein
MVTHLALFRQRALVMAALAFVVVLILWHVPQLDFVLYPLRLFVTFVHESGHGLAAIVSGGHFERFVVLANGGGYAVTGGVSRALILPAGYLGAALFGAALFYVTNTVPFPKTISIALGIVVAAITLLYTDLLSTAFLVGIAFAFVLIALWRYADRGLNMLVLNVLALIAGLNAVLDLVSLVSNSGVSMGAIRNDAAAFSAQVAPLIPPFVMALLWALIAVALLGASLYYSVLRHLRT